MSSRAERTSQNSSSPTFLNKGKRKGQGCYVLALRCGCRPLLLLHTSCAHLTVKSHVFCCKPVVVGSWSRELPSASLAPVVTTAL